MRKLSILIACLFFTGLAHAQVKISALPTYPQPLVGTEAIPASNVGLSTTQSYQITPNMFQTFMEGLTNSWTGVNTYSNSVELGSPTGGALGAGTLNASTGYYVNGVIVPNYPRTAAEIAAGVTPVNYGYAPGNALRYGCVGDDSTLNDTCIANDIAAAVASGGTGFVYFPAGIYKHASTITLHHNLIVKGDGNGSGTSGSPASELYYTGTSDQMLLSDPKNSSTAANVSIRDINLTANNTAASNFDDVGSTYLYLYDLQLSGAAINLILDQSEIVTVRDCVFEPYTTGAWLVNGPDHTSGASPGYTNEITFIDNQFNAGSSPTLIADDGGVSHKYAFNNFNAGSKQIRVNQVNGLTVLGNEMEGATTDILDFEVTRLNGVTGGPSYTATIQDNLLDAGSGVYVANFANSSIDAITFEDNVTATVTAAINNLSGGVVYQAFGFGNDTDGGPPLFGTGTARSIVLGKQGLYGIDSAGTGQEILDYTTSNNAQLIQPSNATGGGSVQILSESANGCIQFYTGTGVTLNGQICPPGNWTINAPTSGTALAVTGLSGQLGISSTQPIGLPGFTVSTLPTCNTALKGGMAYVTDATSPTYNGALTGGGSTVVPVFCNGSAWTSH